MGLPVQLNYYSNSDTSIIDLQNTADGVIIGHHQVSLTNYDNTSLPAIAIGSVVENNGAMVKFTTECAISGSPSDGSVYILLVPSGDPALGTATVTPTFSNVAPAWSDSKQGWYGTGGSANYRYIAVLNKLSTSYREKRYIKNRDLEITYIVTIPSGTNMGTTNHGISNAFTNKRIADISCIRVNVDYNVFLFVNNLAVTDTAITLQTSGAPIGSDTYAYVTLKYR